MTLTHPDPTITLRPIAPTDEPFLARLYASTRADEMAMVPWDAAQKQAFLAMQFEAQHTFYQREFRDASFDLVLLHNEPIGRLYLHRRADEVRIIDIALLPTYRNRGIGGAFMRAILAEAARAGLPVRIHVERTNPALRLYWRLGFRHVADNGIYFLMEWVPPTEDTPTDAG